MTSDTVTQEELLRLLKRNEHGGEDGQCPECRDFWGHDDDCDWMRAIVELGGEPHNPPPAPMVDSTDYDDTPLFSRDAIIHIERLTD